MRGTPARRPPRERATHIGLARSMNRTRFALALLLSATLAAGCYGTGPVPGDGMQPDPTPTPTGGPVLAGCPVFPADHAWNTRVDHLPVHPDSQAWIERISLEKGLHPDFGSGRWEGKRIGIPYNVTDGGAPRVVFAFDYADESDPGPYPVPADARIEEGRDRHLLVLDASDCTLYELFDVRRTDAGWAAGSGAIFDLRGYELRPDGWTSADAAGLAILPGLVRYDEVASGEIRHALRFTADWTSGNHLWPARHHAATGDLDDPPMGMRVRLRADFDTTGFTPEVRVILETLQKYGMILADNGGDWFITGEPDERWDNDALVGELYQVKGWDLEVVDTTSLMIDPDSGRARRPDVAAGKLASP